jgi:Domain of unknown function (DUF1906)
MRRAIAAAVTGGLVLGGALGTPAFATAHGTGAKASAGKSVKKVTKKPARPARTTKAVTAEKTVVYQGYEFQVPASWPVYRLDEHPQTCVRYDVHAVYLGTPGPNMKCPAGLIGRTQAVSFIPGSNIATGAGAGSASQPEGASGTAVRKLAAVDSTITQDAAHQQMQVALGPSGLGATLMGTYGADPATIRQVLGTLRAAPAGAVTTPQSAKLPELPGSPRSVAALTAATLKKSAARKTVKRAKPATRQPEAAAPDPSSTYTNWHGVPTGWPVEVVKPAPAPSPPKKNPPTQPPPRTVAHPVNGFDTCTTPSLASMAAWKSKYSAVGIYIGGVNSACAYGNLSASWIQSSAAMGYGMIPTYVGPQASCWGHSGTLIDPSKAAAQGTAAAKDAISDVKFFKLPAGSPVYYDMEAYGSSVSCNNAVLAFLSAWDRQMNAAGYVTGVYSSQLSGIKNVDIAATAKSAGFTAPNAVWYALWDNHARVTDADTDAWPTTRRNKQYAGPANVTVGGVTLNVDLDYVGGPVAR